MTQTAYTFDNSSADALDQLASLERCLDPITIAHLTPLVLGAGERCWEIGAGGGSVAAWLATQVGPAGQVVATDINIDRLAHLDLLGNVAVIRHDITSLSVPVDSGPYSLIHARLVLLHLPSRRRILEFLTAQLAPGGWLVLEEFAGPPLRLYLSRSDIDSDIFGRVTAAIIEILERNGADLAWAHEVYAAMRAAGLADVRSTTHSESWTGGGIGAALHATNSRQLAAQLDAAGITPGELERFRAIVSDPGHAACSYPLVTTRGRRAG